MQSVCMRAYRAAAWVVFVAIILQFAAAGLLVFRGRHNPHLAIGTLLPLVSLVALLLALGARLPRRALALNGALLALLVAQHLILGFGQALPWLLVLHIVVPSVLPIIALAAARTPSMSVPRPAVATSPQPLVEG